MIEVSHLVKEFKIPVQKKGRFAAVRNLFSSEHTIKRAVDDITFSVDDGEIVGFIGKNGAGKSTTIKMLSGILQPTSGNVTVDGIKPFEQRMENAKQIGVVFGQKTQLWWDVPLIESYRLLKEIYKIEDGTYRKNLDRYIPMLDLEEVINKPVRQMSLGQRVKRISVRRCYMILKSFFWMSLRLVLMLFLRNIFMILFLRLIVKKVLRFCLPLMTWGT